jgi:hypothetical protein
MKKQSKFSVFILAIFLLSCQKDKMPVQLENENVTFSNLKSACNCFVAFTCVAKDSQGQAYAGIRCKAGGGTCTQETGCIPIQGGKSLSNNTIAVDFVNQGIANGIFNPDSSDFLIQLANQSLDAVD